MSVAPHIRETMNSRNASVIRRMFEEGASLKQKYGAENVFDFSIGNPDLEPPGGVLSVIETIAKSRAAGMHGYMPNAGYHETRLAMAKKVSLEQGVVLDADHVVMSVGAAAALNCVLKAILSPGDEVVVPAPFFAEYNHYVKNHGGVLVPVPTRGDFSLDVAAVSAALSKKTAAVLINSPNNPTGKIYSKSDISELASALDRHSTTCGRRPCLLCDEPYRDIVYDGASVPAVFPFYDEAVVVSSFAKNLSLPGERIGYIAVNPANPNATELVAACTFTTRILGFVNAPAFFQRVIAEAWNVPADFSSYAKRRGQLMAVLDCVGIEYVRPEGAFYLFCKVPPKAGDIVANDWVGDDGAFCDHLKSHRVLCAPGTGFGCPGWFRMAFCTSERTIEGARAAMAQALESWKI